ncbi:hypothetical protein F5Y10DRAFT_270516 [Nemania abortiva]|nr:hypothetical protein F5Y10DRAFT_270516 [Nemania abortiva]
MSNIAQKRPREARESLDDFIELCFDLENAQLPCDSQPRGPIPGFKPITRREQDPHVAWIISAVERENASGGFGPFAFHHSPVVFIGSDGEAEERNTIDTADDANAIGATGISSTDGTAHAALDEFCAAYTSHAV